MNHILFVCTGNIFRSMIAEHALRYTAGTTSDYSFSSAGTEAKAQPMVDIVRQGLNARGIDPWTRSAQAHPELFDGADLVVAIGLDHVAFIEETYKETPVLFDEVAYGRAKPFSTPGRPCQITKPTQSTRCTYSICAQSHLGRSRPFPSQRFWLYPQRGIYSSSSAMICPIQSGRPQENSLTPSA